jgi:hypothetical protein
MNDIIETKVEFKAGIKYVTHFVNRPIRQGDPHGGATGMCVNGVNTTTEITNYIYINQA